LIRVLLLFLLLLLWLWLLRLSRDLIAHRDLRILFSWPFIIFFALLPLSVFCISFLLLQEIILLLLIEQFLLFLHVLLKVHDILSEDLLIVRVLLHLLCLIGILWLTLKVLHHLGGLLEVRKLLFYLGLDLMLELLES
jgi:hypothetical protein